MQDRVLGFANGLVRAANALNWLAGVGFVVAIPLSFVFGEALAAQLSFKYHGRNVAETMLVLRIMAVLGIVAAIALRQLFTRLLAIVATVQAGDPFVAANADRLQRIGWALLALQLIDLALGAVALVLDRLGADHATWMPSLAGWIAVVMMFVLARVFRVGAAMRDDLAMTV
ncbi:DUF2975 domain-containing protein [Sphingomonas sp. RT2P30]|uniref:DUF2975 domain-containing protein n=1 Tax=Parasphingomonas halimpatiens TaxID=3096162 RepID=UPI002FC75651